MCCKPQRRPPSEAAGLPARAQPPPHPVGPGKRLLNRFKRLRGANTRSSFSRAARVLLPPRTGASSHGLSGCRAGKAERERTDLCEKAKRSAPPTPGCTSAPALPLRSEFWHGVSSPDAGTPGRDEACRRRAERRPGGWGSERAERAGRRATRGEAEETKEGREELRGARRRRGPWTLAQKMAPEGAWSGRRRWLRLRPASHVPASSKPACAGLSEIEARVQRAGLAVVVPVRAMHHGELGLPGAGELQARCVGGRGRRGRGGSRAGWAELARGRCGGPVVRRGWRGCGGRVQMVCVRV